MITDEKKTSVRKLISDDLLSEAIDELLGSVTLENIINDLTSLIGRLKNTEKIIIWVL